MQYDDTALANEESMCNLQKGYAKMSPVCTASVKTLANEGKLEEGIYSLFSQEIDLLKTLSNYAQNQNIREYLLGLSQKSEAELQKLLQDYPSIDTSLNENPVFYNRRNSNQNFKNFLHIDLELINKLNKSMQTISSESERTVLGNMLSRHILALDELFGLMHLISFC